MASGLGTLGVLGAVLIIAGGALIGFGFLNAASAENAANNCQYQPPPTQCISQDRTALNASIQDEMFLGLGFAVVGVGGGCLLIAAVSFMSRWPPAGAPAPAGPTLPPPLPPLSPPGA